MLILTTSENGLRFIDGAVDGVIASTPVPAPMPRGEVGNGTEAPTGASGVQSAGTSRTRCLLPSVRTDVSAVSW